ncbi:hypothetical protein D3C81_653960 [compost metagenome]
MLLGELHDLRHLLCRRLLIRGQAGNRHLGQPILPGQVTKCGMLRDKVLTFGVRQSLDKLLIQLFELVGVSVRVLLVVGSMLGVRLSQGSLDATDLLDR